MDVECRLNCHRKKVSIKLQRVWIIQRNRKPTGSDGYLKYLIVHSFKKCYQAR